MIAKLRGALVGKAPGEIVLDVGGVGYHVFVSLTTFYELPEPGREVTLDIHTHVREDAIQLYGFTDPHEREVFRLLLGVSGIGPRLATNVLSGIPAADMVEALIAGDVARLIAIPGVGRKLAERLTVELKERAALLRNGRAAGRTRAMETREGASFEREATSALVNLGYRAVEAERAVKSAAASGGGRLEDLIRIALRSLAG
jgi:Holliday junction DNA helicase RuvA